MRRGIAHNVRVPGDLAALFSAIAPAVSPPRVGMSVIPLTESQMNACVSPPAVADVPIT